MTKKRPTQADVLKTALDNRNMTQSHFAIEIGLDRPFVNRILAGKQTMPQDKVPKVADLLTLNPDVLYVTAGQIPPDVLQTIVDYPSLIHIIRKHGDVMRLKAQEGLNRPKKTGTLQRAAVRAVDQQEG